tara:strand:- start:2955 stop:3167 length:213 start_codon:yes stop_codon:yes gene_type:complete
MNEELLNIQVRKFLKQVGIKSQREIENSIKLKFEKGLLDKIDVLDVSVLLEIDKIGLKVPIKGKIEIKGN